MEVRDLRASESDIVNDIRQDIEDRIHALGPDFREIFPFYKEIEDTIKAVQQARERNAGVKTVSLAEQVWNCGEKAVKDGLQFVSKEAQKAKDFAVKSGKQVVGGAAGLAQDGLQAVGLQDAAKSAGEVKDFITKPGLKNRLAQSGKQVVGDVMDGGKKLVTGIIKTSKDFAQSGVKLMDETWNCGVKYKQKVDRVVDRAIINVTESARRRFMGR